MLDGSKADHLNEMTIPVHMCVCTDIDIYLSLSFVPSQHYHVEPAVNLLTLFLGRIGPSLSTYAQR